MGESRSSGLPNGALVSWGKLVLSFVAGLAAAITLAFTTFEFQTSHDTDISRMERLLSEKELRDAERFRVLRDRLDMILFGIPVEPSQRR